MLLAVTPSDIRDIRIVGRKFAEVSDMSGERRAFGQMASRVLVSGRAGAFERELDHRAQDDRRGKRMLLGQNLGGRRQKLVKIAVQFLASP